MNCIFAKYLLLCEREGLKVKKQGGVNEAAQKHELLPSRRI